MREDPNPAGDTTNTSHLLAAAAVGVQLVRTTLARATDQQLAYNGLSVKERDTLLGKTTTLALYKKHEKTGLGQFYPRYSRKLDTNFMGVRDDYSVKDLRGASGLCEFAAHEHFHAARFWNGQQHWQRPRTNKGLLMTAGGAITMFAGFATLSPQLLVSGLSLMVAGKFQNWIEPYDFENEEERSAHRFGFMFHSETYKGELHLVQTDKKKLKEIVWEEKKSGVSRGYPKADEIVPLFRQASLECSQGSPENLFFKNLSDLNQKLFEAADTCFDNPDIRIHPEYVVP